ncbi:MAG: DUF2958 domain-containing protein [Deltaproteobacteria bacterium]|nr:DUF2958 domain-containing protein [Deltaproteobacteria bacterium]
MGRDVLKTLEGFIGGAQLRCMVDGCRGEEGDYFKGKLSEMADTVATMPDTYGQESLGNLAVVHLHYFVGACDWHITERDCDPDGQGQIQAFGVANLGYGAELGYISIQEILANGGELDLHWAPKTLKEVARDGV